MRFKLEVARPTRSRRTKKLSRYSMARAICSDVAFPSSRSSRRWSRTGYAVVDPHSWSRISRFLSS
jgi:hypothetical protein